MAPVEIDMLRCNSEEAMEAMAEWLRRSAEDYFRASGDLQCF